MYDCSVEFNKFYRKKVVLSAKEQNELRKKRRLNIKRLKDGLSDYNNEKGTDYKISEERIQGSMAMHTITQNDQNDYDIDVGIVFDSNKLNELGPLATRKMVSNSLERKTQQFAEKPDVKTSCVRLKYSSKGYHVDFAIFKRYKENPEENYYTFQHAGYEWSVRHIKDLEDWFNEEIKSVGDNLRKIIRLSKMFCKSRAVWINMPSGLIQTVLCVENYNNNYLRLDETFYYSMKSIIDRLDLYLEVEAPVDDGRELVTRETDYQRMSNWKSRLESKIKKLDVLFDEDCTYNDAIKAWEDFFNHPFWGNLLEAAVSKELNESKISFNDTEEYIEDLYPVYEKYDVTIDCKVSGNGFSVMPISEYLDKFAPRLNEFIPKKFSVNCKIGSTNCPSYDKILWKVVNVGSEAKRRNEIRGQIQDRGKGIKENSKFIGKHYIECYLIKNEVCVAIGHVNVPIGGN